MLFRIAGEMMAIMEMANTTTDIVASVRRPRRTPAFIMERILTAASDEFTERGFASATTLAIARRADVTEAQLFRYFSSKSDLFREAVFKPLDRHFSEFNERMLKDAGAAGSHEENVGRYIHELQQFIGDHSRLLMSLIVAQTYAASGPEDRIASLTSYFDSGAAMMASRVGSDPVVDPQLMVRVSFAAVLGTVLFREMLFPQAMASDQEIEAATIRFVTDGINANPITTQPSLMENI